MNRRISILVAIVGINLMACCCGGFGGNQVPRQRAVAKPVDAEQVEQPKLENPIVAPPIEKKSRSGRVYVSRKQMGDKWPLTIEDGEIECYKGFGILFHSGTSGGVYAVNGGAMNLNRWPSIDVLRADAPRSEFWIKNNIPAIKKDIGPLLDIGLELCKKQR